MFDNIKKVGLYFILRDNPKDLFLLIFWGWDDFLVWKMQTKFAKWIKALKDWDEGEDLLMEKPSSL